MDKPSVTKQYRALVIATIIAVLFGAYFLRNFFSLLVIAAIMAFLFNPVYQYLAKRTKRRGSAATLTFVISLFAIIIPIVFLLFITYFQIKHIIGNLPEPSATDISKLGDQLLSSINKWLAHIPGTHPLTPESISASLNKMITSFIQNTLQLITSSVGSIISFITSLIIYIYVFLALLIHQDSLVNTIKALNPLGDKNSNMYLQKMGDMTKAMVRGQFIIATLQGLAGALSFYAIGVHDLFFFLWLIFSVLCVIPLGSGIVIIPAGVIMLLFGDIWQAAVVLGTHFLITTNIDNILRPRLVPKRARLNSALTILSVFAGIGMFGFLGIVIGPVLMIVIISTLELYIQSQKPAANKKA